MARILAVFLEEVDEILGITPVQCQQRQGRRALLGFLAGLCALVGDDRIGIAWFVAVPYARGLRGHR